MSASINDCPFCCEKQWRLIPDEGYGWRFECPKCGALGPHEQRDWKAGSSLWETAQTMAALGRLFISRKSNKWISVKDRLPDTGIEVLVVSGTDREVAWRHIDDGEWSSYSALGHVTHWMPLPALPEEEVL
jgi:hypothetical protein